ncbi:Calcium/calmodulin-dependent protein kinase type IV [Trichoplax sp. H2]|nr:Calcium/calmodulin-dependent protein kinase type IV [Trichoplax sp. H2]|eukprot:RDD37455.1 Calcium/calmodulin-dependent protein kinase type IV [Trichoplax sp. H2]
MVYLCQTSNRDVVREKYEIGKEIGRGPNSVMRECIQIGTKKSYSMKTLRKHVIDRATSKEDMSLMLFLSHPNIIRLEEVYETENDIHFILDCIDGCDIFTSISQNPKYSEYYASSIIRQVCQGLRYLHEYNIVHGNIKPENLIVKSEKSEPSVKIADHYLLSVLTTRVKMNYLCNSQTYCAPEVLTGKKYDHSVDMWAVGILLYTLLCGYDPFYDERGSKETFRKILQGSYEFDEPYWKGVSQSAKEVVMKLLQVNPKSRPTADQVLKMPWVKGIAASNRTLVRCHAAISAFIEKRKLNRKLVALSGEARQLQETMSADVDSILKAEEEARKLMAESINDVQAGGPVILTQAMENMESLKPEDPMAISMKYNYVPSNVFYGKKAEKNDEINSDHAQGAQPTEDGTNVTNEEPQEVGATKEEVAATLIANTVSYKIFASLESDLIPKKEVENHNSEANGD